MRPRQVRRVLALATFGAILAGTGVGYATDAHADAATDYAALNAGRICATLDQFPTVDGIAGIGTAIVNEGYLSFYDAGRAIGLSIVVVCPEYKPLMDQFIARYSNSQRFVA